jgi:hypothetical protein
VPDLESILGPGGLRRTEQISEISALDLVLLDEGESPSGGERPPCPTLSSGGVRRAEQISEISALDSGCSGRHRLRRAK